MTKTEDTLPADDAPKPAPNAVLQMIVTMADTTWRMFVPILSLLLVGIYFDKASRSFPWMTLLGFALGVAVSALLIRNQFKKGTK